jgi:hypothetical protein
MTMTPRLSAALAGGLIAPALVRGFQHRIDVIGRKVQRRAGLF